MENIAISGYEVGYSGTDFEQNKISKKKTFYINGLKSYILYTGYKDTFTVRYQFMPGCYKQIVFTKDFLKDCSAHLSQIIKDFVNQ